MDQTAHLLLPRPLGAIRISPFHNGAADNGRFLVEVGERGFVMNHPACQLVAALAVSTEPSEVRRILRESGSGDITEGELRTAVDLLPQALFSPDDRAPGAGIFLLHFRLLPEKWVQWFARILQPAFDPRVACLMLAALVAALPWRRLAEGAPPAALAGGGAGWLLLALLISALAHEFGHASACRRFGVEPGAIGFGLYWAFPVFYADVTRAWRLAPRQRVIVDLGGLYFQAVVLLLAVPLWWGAEASWVRLFYLYNFGAMIHNLNPLFKMDGYWLLSDFACVPNLHRRTLALTMELLGRKPAAGSEMNRRMKWMLGGYAALLAGYVGYLAGGIPLWLENYFYPGLRAGRFAWDLAFDQFGAGAWAAAGQSCFRGSLSLVAVGLPLLLVPLALGKTLAVVRARWQASPRRESVA